jgi:hypothetical protein
VFAADHSARTAHALVPDAQSEPDGTVIGRIDASRGRRRL